MIFKFLNQLSPAQAHLMLHPLSATRKDLLKLTFKDLVMRKVLTVYDHITPVPGLDTGLIYKYVKVGEHFSSYSLKEFEEVFLRFFIRYPNEQILLTNLIKSVFSEVKSNERYYEKIVSTDPVQEYFKKSWIRHLFGGYLLTPSGKAALSQLSAEMEEAISTINKLLANKDVAIRELLMQINGNVFLLQGISLDLLKEVDTSFNEHYPKDQYNGCSGCSIWDSYADISDGIDSGCSGCSGCGGDGGCSGCGGCGGGD